MSIILVDNGDGTFSAIDGVDLTGSKKGLWMALDPSAADRNLGDPDQFGVGVDECNYSIIDHADTSPVAVSVGVPALVFYVLCVEDFAGSPQFILSDGASQDTPLPINWVVGDRLEFSGDKHDTDYSVYITAAGTAGKIRTGWRKKGL